MYWGTEFLNYQNFIALGLEDLFSCEAITASISSLKIIQLWFLFILGGEIAWKYGSSYFDMLKVFWYSENIEEEIFFWQIWEEEKIENKSLW